MKRLSADDSAGSRVKVGHRQATIEKRPTSLDVRVHGVPDSTIRGRQEASLRLHLN